jgi:FKBP-type peptidyl-prolyl cis-trans isomerase
MIAAGLYMAPADTYASDGTTTLDTLVFQNFHDSLQYSLGTYLAQWVNKNGFLIDNPSVFIKGMDAVFRGIDPVIPDSLANMMVHQFQHTIQLQKNRRIEKQLFDSLKSAGNLGYLPSGEYFKIIHAGQGIHPSPEDTVLMHIVAKTADGIEYENTRKAGMPVLRRVNNLVPGLSAALPMMGEGDVWKLYIPSERVYGDRVNTGLPPGSSIEVEVALLHVRRKQVH